MLVGPLVKQAQDQLTAVMVLTQFLEVLQVLVAEAAAVINFQVIVDILVERVALVVEQEKMKQIQRRQEPQTKVVLVERVLVAQQVVVVAVRVL